MIHPKVDDVNSRVSVLMYWFDQLVLGMTALAGALASTEIERPRILENTVPGGLY